MNYNSWVSGCNGCLLHVDRVLPLRLPSSALRRGPPMLPSADGLSYRCMSKLPPVQSGGDRNSRPLFVAVGSFDKHVAVCEPLGRTTPVLTWLASHKEKIAFHWCVWNSLRILRSSARATDRAIGGTELRQDNRQGNNGVSDKRAVLFLPCSGLLLQTRLVDFRIRGLGLTRR